MDQTTGEFWAAIAGAIVGAAIGGIISYCLQRQAFAAETVKRDQDKLERQQTLARSFIVKLTILYSHVSQLDRTIKQVFATANATGHELYQIALPILPIPSAVTFSTDELTILLTLKLDDQFNDAAMMDERHNNLYGILNIFNEKAVEFREKVTPQAFTGMMGHIESTNAQLQELRPYMLALNQLVIALRDQSDALTKDSWALVTTVTAGFNSKLNLGLKIMDAFSKPNGSSPTSASPAPAPDETG